MQPSHFCSFGAGGTNVPPPRASVSSFNVVLPSRTLQAPRGRARLSVSAGAGNGSGNGNGSGGKSTKLGENLEDRIASGEFDDSGSTKEQLLRPLRKLLAKDTLGPGEAQARPRPTLSLLPRPAADHPRLPGMAANSTRQWRRCGWQPPPPTAPAPACRLPPPPRAGRVAALQLARVAQDWRRAAAERMPEARGDIREIVGQPVFVPLYKLFCIYGKVFRLSFGPKTFVVISDSQLAKQVLLTNAANYSKGLLSEILEFVMGTGLIPADGEVWRVRRRAILPALHKKYISAMVDMFADCAVHGGRTLGAAADAGGAVEMENFFSRLALDIIGKAVFNYEFDSLTTDDPVIQAVYTTLREAEYRSTYPLPYWNFPPLRWLVPRQRQCQAALAVISDTLDELIAKCRRLVEEEDEEFVEEFLSRADPSILHFLVASGEEITSKQLRDDLMTMLIAGHETTAAVLTWTFHCLADRPDVVAALQAEVDAVLGDRSPTVEDMKALRYTTRVINESMRLYPQPPVLIRRALADDVVGGYKVPAGADIFISVWNIHRSPAEWANADAFDPGRFPTEGPTPNEVTEDFRYLPFGGGRRKCIGDQFALFESIVALAMMMRRFEFVRGADAPAVGMTTGATIHTTNGLWLQPKRRQHAGGEAPPAAPTAAQQQAGGAVPEVAMAFTEAAEGAQ
jgi:beta-ring hydroxylase